MVEDSAADALLIEYALRRAGMTFDSRRVETRDDFLAELRRATPDVILSDHGLPTFDGFNALEIAQQHCPGVPFIFVTGSNDQAMMIEMLESGATDFVFKNRLSDLVPAISRSLEAAAAKTAPPPPVAQPVPKSTPRWSSTSVRLCCVCKKVFPASGEAMDLDVFLRTSSGATFKTFVCPVCSAGMN